MGKFRSIFERINSRDSGLNSVGTASTTGSQRMLVESNCDDMWSRLERAIQRGKPEEVLKWKEELTASGKLHHVGNIEEEEQDEEEKEEEDDYDIEEEMTIPRYLRRSSEFAGRICLTPLQLAVVERKRDVVQALLQGLGEAAIRASLTAKMRIVDQAPKKFLSETRKMFSVGNLSVASISAAMHNVVSSRRSGVNWLETWEWSVLHLAVKYDISCLKVLLFTLESQMSSSKVENILEIIDSRGSTLLHLAARDPSSSTALKLLLDAGAKVDPKNQSFLTPLHMAVKFGVVDTARELLDHGADKDRTNKDVAGRGMLHYAHSPDMIRFLLSRGYHPDLDTLRYQTSQKGAENVKVLLENSVFVEGDLLVLDFSLAMEQDKSGNQDTDGEYVFLRNFLSHRNLLHVPLVEALLQMKWFACRRVILMDLFIYTVFIMCLTGVICLSTGASDNIEDDVNSSESALIDFLIENYRSELERRGWTFIPRSTSHLDEIQSNISTYKEHTVIELPYQQFFGFYYFTVFLSIIFLLREFLELVADGPRKYFSSVENIFEVFIIFLTVLCQIFLRFYSENIYFYEILQVMTVFFGWLGLTFHLARLPTVGIFIYLAIKVFRQLVLSLLIFTTILLAFAFSFHLAMRKHHVFDNAFTSFLKMINMMVGEYNFDEIFTFQAVRSVGGSNGIVQLLLVSFTLLVGVTIANLIVALVIANMKKLMTEADAYQLSKTVELLSKVHNVKRALIRIFPCLQHVFAPTLYDYIGKKTSLCIRIDQVDPKLSILTRLQNLFQSSDIFFPVYTYDFVYRREMELTDLALPGRIVMLARENCKLREKERECIRFEGNNDDYSSDWRLGMEQSLLA